MKKYIKFILPMLTLIITLITVIAVLKLNILPNKYLILFIIGELILLLISLIQLLKNKILKVIGIVISIISVLINIFGLYYINNTNSFLNKKFTGDITYSSTYYVITNSKEDLTLDDIEDIHYYKYSPNVDKAKELLGEYNYKETENIEETLKKEVYLLIDESNYKLLNKEYKKIYEFNIEWSEKRVSNKQDSYNIFIGGRDFTRSLMDFNMLLTINTKTKTILITSIPRDYYMYVPDYGMYDSLEFMGLLGERTTMNSLSNLLDTNIDLYASLYTEGLVEVVDLLGGIDYCSDIDFTTTHALVQDTYYDYGEKLTIHKGCQHLNGIETLTVARERLHVGSDRARQNNCRQIFKTIMSDSLSMTTLTNYEELLNKVSNLYETNIDKKTIQKLIKSLINNKYTIIEQSLDGSDGSNYIRLGAVQSYVMYPDYSTVDRAKDNIKTVLEGK